MIKTVIKLVTITAGLALISSAPQAGFNDEATNLILEEIGQEIVYLGNQHWRRKYRTYRPHSPIKTMDQVGKCKGRC